MSTHGDLEIVTEMRLRDWALPGAGDTKNSRGRLLVAGGSRSTPGAVMLAGLAALRVGAGVLGLAVAESVAGPVAAAVPEASVTGLPQLDGGRDGGELAGAVSGMTTVLVGPGLDDPQAAEDLVRLTIEAVDSSTSLVLDAFALGVLPALDRVDRIAGRCVLTPNPNEAARLLELDEVDDDDEPQVASEIAKRFGAVVSFQNTVASPDGGLWSVPTGHAGLGTSGSGDVLAGAVAGLLARGADLAQAACWGTFLHGSAGDRLASRVGRLGFLARELVDELPLVIVQTEA
jgi:ADP-dependent NAD(P)H-hydrate dehydratase